MIINHVFELINLKKLNDITILLSYFQFVPMVGLYSNPLTSYRIEIPL